jgi:hypothetical protein
MGEIMEDWQIGLFSIGLYVGVFFWIRIERDLGNPTPFDIFMDAFSSIGELFFNDKKVRNDIIEEYLIDEEAKVKANIIRFVATHDVKHPGIKAEEFKGE